MARAIVSLKFYGCVVPKFKILISALWQVRPECSSKVVLLVLRFIIGLILFVVVIAILRD